MDGIKHLNFMNKLTDKHKKKNESVKVSKEQMKDFGKLTSNTKQGELFQIERFDLPEDKKPRLSTRQTPDSKIIPN